MANPNDTIRDAILRHLYTVHQNARGPKGVAIGIRDLQRTMKTIGFSQKEVNSNLDYLLQKGWLSIIEEKKTYRTKGGTTQESISTKYKISDVGIDRLEVASTYQREQTSSHINITNIKGVTVIGDGNVVNSEYADLSRYLNELKEAIIQNQDTENDVKLNMVSDIETLQSQLQKPKPNKTIVKTIWYGIEKIVTAGSFIELINKITPLILPLIT